MPLVPRGMSGPRLPPVSPVIACGRAGADVGPAPSRSSTRVTISSILRSSSVAIAYLVLRVAALAVDRDLVDDRHDRRVHRSVLGDLGLTRRAAAGVQHDLAEA